MPTHGHMPYRPHKSTHPSPHGASLQKPPQRLRPGLKGHHSQSACLQSAPARLRLMTYDSGSPTRRHHVISPACPLLIPRGPHTLDGSASAMPRTDHGAHRDPCCRGNRPPLTLPCYLQTMAPGLSVTADIVVLSTGHGTTTISHHWHYRAIHNHDGSTVRHC